MLYAVLILQVVINVTLAVFLCIYHYREKYSPKVPEGLGEGWWKRLCEDVASVEVDQRCAVLDAAVLNNLRRDGNNGATIQAIREFLTAAANERGIALPVTYSTDKFHPGPSITTIHGVPLFDGDFGTTEGLRKVLKHRLLFLDALRGGTTP